MEEMIKKFKEKHKEEMEDYKSYMELVDELQDMHREEIATIFRDIACEELVHAHHIEHILESL